MNTDLLLQAVRLAELGGIVEKARLELKALAESGQDYSSEQMKAALARYECAKAAWDNLEKEHLELRRRVSQ